MSNAWMIYTHGDPLNTLRRFLQDLWEQAELQGMLLPVYHDGETETTPRIVDSKEQIQEADPCVPFMPVNASKLVVEYARQFPQGRFGAILRSCEGRALIEITQREEVDLRNWLIIGVDCLASYPEDDFDWRVQKAGSVERLTKENLEHARQGGIALHRFRNACQMCTSPQASLGDVVICLLGLPVKHVLLVQAKDKDTARKLHLDQITDGEAPHALVVQRQTTVNTLAERRARTLDHMIQDLNENLPQDVDELIEHLQNCAPCRQCLDACPIYSYEAAQAGSEPAFSREAAVRWLVSCVSCGMCEQACPNHLPLVALLKRISQELKFDLAPA
jgi:formate dehydrogenase subunit beta